MAQLRLKSGVDLSALEPGGARILAVIAAAPLVLGFDVTISCGREGHGPDDPHTHGNALDIRVIDHTPEEILSLYKYCGGQLGETFFTVLYECPVALRATLDPRLAALVYAPSDPDAPHIHCQVRMHTAFPPAEAAPSTPPIPQV